jgi:hypothetical protein
MEYSAVYWVASEKVICKKDGLSEKKDIKIAIRS